MTPEKIVQNVAAIMAVEGFRISEQTLAACLEIVRGLKTADEIIDRRKNSVRKGSYFETAASCTSAQRCLHEKEVSDGSKNSQYKNSL